MSAWHETTLGEACELYQPQTISSAELVADGAYPVYGANGVIGKYDKFNHVEPQLLVTCRGATCGAINISQPKAWINGNAMVVKPRDDSIELSYLAHLFRGGIDLSMVITGAAQPQITRQSLAPVRVRFPPLEEQLRITAILDQAETLRTQRRQALAHLDTLTQSLFFDMFGDGSTPEPTIGELLEKKVLLLHKDGNHGSLYPRAEEFGDEGVPFLSARCVSDGGEIQEQFIDRLQDQKANQLRIGWIEKGDVLLAHNASVGKVALYDGRYPKALIGTSLTAFRADQSILSPEFLAAAFRSTKFQAQLFKNMGQTTRNQVPITAQRELRVALPPLALQQTFATRIQAIEALKATHRAALAQLDALFASLQQRAFAGEL